MSGNLNEVLGTAEGVTLALNADTTGKMIYGGEAADVSWAPESNDAIYVTPQSANGFAKQEAILVAYKNDALFMPFEQNGQQITIIFTKDGNYQVVP